jgi:hypothetical protein
VAEEQQAQVRVQLLLAAQVFFLQSLLLAGAVAQPPQQMVLAAAPGEVLYRVILLDQEIHQARPHLKGMLVPLVLINHMELAVAVAELEGLRRLCQRYLM